MAIKSFTFLRHLVITYFSRHFSRSATNDLQQNSIMDLIFQKLSKLEEDLRETKRTTERVEDVICAPLDVPYCNTFDDYNTVDEIARVSLNDRVIKT